ncbi:MAG TPA: hypothetical protein VG847_07135 [Chitinophagaceae bacterium]|nr:hypothetical protein [Chitinophagaceae bacterium]
MKPVRLFAVMLLYSSSVFSQKPKITWGDEFKLHKGSTDLDVLSADKSGVYLQESHLALKSYFVIGASVRESATLIKLDNNLSELYHNDFNKELRGKEFEEFFALQNKIFIIASDYSKRDRALSVYGAEVDKSSGELASGWTPLITLQKDEKKDEIRFKIVPNSDSTRIVLVSSVEGKEKNTYQIQEFDNRLNPSAKPVTIANEFDPKTFQLQDVVYTNTRKILLVGRIYEYEEGKKKKDKFLDFVNYNIRLYDETGKQQAEVNTDINGKWLMSTKVFQKDDKDLVLTAFYSNEKRGKSIDGMLVERIDPVSGNVLSTSEKEINNSLLTAASDSSGDESADDETKAERKERERLDKIKDEGEGFSRYMKFRNIFYTSDGGIIVLAEHYHHYSYTTSSYTPGTNGTGYWSNTTYYVYECGDILMTKIDAAGNLSWLKVLPKSQREVTSDGSSTGFFTTDFFDFGNRPFYAGFGAMQTNGIVNILFNDNPKNAEVTQPGQRVKLTNRFGKSDCFIVSLDELTGKYTRNQFFSNAEVPTAMPRLGSVIGDNMYITGKDDRLFGKTKIAVAKIAVR